MASAAKELAELAELARLLMNIARHLRQLSGARVTAVRAGEADAVLLALLPEHLAELLAPVRRPVQERSSRILKKLVLVEMRRHLPVAVEQS